MFEGVQLVMPTPITIASPDLQNTGWIDGTSPLNVKISADESKYFPWTYNCVFTGNNSAYTSKVNSTSRIKDAEDIPVGPSQVLLDQSFSFYVINKSFTDSYGEYEKLDMLVYDKNSNGVFEYDIDEILVGYSVESGSNRYWAGTVFAINFSAAFTDSEMPENGDVYQVTFKRPYSSEDYFEFTVNPPDELNEDELKENINNVKVVPNPYVMTNTLEPAVANYQLNQRRQLMFINIPAQCVIKIFTVSGVLVDEILVDNSVSNRATSWDLNSSSNGTAFWDLKSREGLDVASGYYIYQVKSSLTGEEKVGKFAIIK